MASSNNTPRVALYARVSTKNNGQDPETQLMALREYAKARGFEVFAEYVDVGISGAKETRPALDRLMDHARKRRFDSVLVARFDRFARSTRHLVLALDEFNALALCGRQPFETLVCTSEFMMGDIQTQDAGELSVFHQGVCESSFTTAEVENAFCTAQFKFR